MDLLQMSAIEFNKLTKYQYYFKIARKNVLKEFVLNFEKEDFYHLAGLHKLKDIAKVQNQKHSIVFQNILDGKISLDNIMHSEMYSEMENRLLPLTHLQYCIESNQIIFQYLEKNIKFSRIQADYLTEYADNTDIVFLFLRERCSTKNKDNIPQVCCESIFPRSEGRDFSFGQPIYTLLYKSKIDLLDNSKKVLYDYESLKVQMVGAESESERRSVKNKLNENMARLSIQRAEKALIQESEKQSIPHIKEQNQEK